MNALRLLGGAAMALALMSGLSTQAMAQKLDNKKNPTPTAIAVGDIDFGDDSSQWANDGECDDPRFYGEGSAVETLPEDMLKDATDCRAAYEGGTVQFDAAIATGPTPGMIDFGDDSSEWAKDGECDDPRFTGEGSAVETLDEDIGRDATDCRTAFEDGTVTYISDATAATTTTVPAIDFGDDSSEWAKDEECDDPRFVGAGSATETLPEDIGRDATDCEAAYNAGTVTYQGDDTAAAAAIDFGDDSSEWAKDEECDDPRFVGAGSAAETLPEDIGRDATDCEAAYNAGTVTYQGDDTAAAAAIDFGDDSSEWANDDECDDPRFAGTGSAAQPLAEDIGRDASDCEAAYNAGTVTYQGDNASSGDIDYGNDTSTWANDGECDDPRFSGTGVASELLDSDIGRDATDCRAAVEAGTATFNGGGAVAAFDYGSDWSKWANDGECDDLRFTGPGTDKKLLTDDVYGDATDCRTLEAAGQVTIRTVYSPDYAAGAPYDTSHIEWGDNKSDYANDDRCDDPRFEGPGVASVLLDSDEYHDAADCRAAYEAGTIIMIGEEDAQG